MKKIKLLLFSVFFILTLVSCSTKDAIQKENGSNSSFEKKYETDDQKKYALIEIEKEYDFIVDDCPIIRIALEYEKVQKISSVKIQVAYGYVFTSEKMKFLFDNQPLQFSIIRSIYDNNNQLVSESIIDTIKDAYNKKYEIKSEYIESSNQYLYCYKNKILDKFNLDEAPSQGKIAYHINLIFENEQKLPSISSLPQSLPEFKYEIVGGICKFEEAF